MYYITLLRHGESTGNHLGVIQGQSDFPLTDHGQEQVRRLADGWQAEGVNFNLILSSPLLRARQTAESIAEKIHSPIEFDAAWKERYFGQLEGKPLIEIEKQDSQVDFFHPFTQVGGDGESQLDLYTRASLAVQSLLRRPPGKYLVVSHGAILNKALYAIIGITPLGHYNSPVFHFSNAGYATLRYHPERRQWAVLAMNIQGRMAKGKNETVFDE